MFLQLMLIEFDVHVNEFEIHVQCLARTVKDLPFILLDYRLEI